MSSIDDLLDNEWLPVCEILGRERTTKLINNGTTLAVAKAMCCFMAQVKQLNRL